MDCLGEAHQQSLKTSEHLRDSSMSETWAVSIDLRDAYFHVPVAPKHTRFLCFAYDGRAYKLLVLPFGLSAAPRVFTRIVRVIEAFLKIQGVDMHQYLDDWLFKNQSRSLVERQRDLTLFWVNILGFLVNEGKSQLIPTQFPAFLGSTLDLINMLVFPSEKRVVKVSCLASSLLARGPQPAKTWQKLLGHLSSLGELVPMAVTHTRQIQLMLHSQWTQVSDSPYIRIYLDHESVSELEWWAGRLSVPQARSDYDDSYGCLHGGVGRSPRRLGDLRPVVVGLCQAPYQLVRALGSVADFAAFPASGTGHYCGCPYGQFHHSGLYQQGGRESVGLHTGNRLQTVTDH